MITVHSFVFNPFFENTYLLYDETNECVIIDAGCTTPLEYETIIGFIKKNKLNPVKLLNTHGHIDHVLGNGYLKHLFNIPIAAHIEDNDLIEQAVEYSFFFGMDVEQPPIPDIFIKDNEIILFGESRLQAIHVPGHSKGGLAFYCEAQEFVISGDTLFDGSIGRTDLPGGNYKQLLESIKSKLFVLPDNTVVYPGHGEETTIGKEKKDNPYLK